MVAIGASYVEAVDAEKMNEVELHVGTEMSGEGNSQLVSGCGGAIRLRCRFTLGVTASKWCGLRQRLFLQR